MDLRKYREKRGLGLNEAAAAAGISPGALCSAELGTRFPTPATILKIKAWATGAGGRPAVTEVDLLKVWCSRQGEKYV